MTTDSGSTCAPVGRWSERLKPLVLSASFALLPLPASAEDLFFWSGNIGTSKAELFLQGPAYPVNYKTTFTDDTVFVHRHRHSVRGYYFYDKYRSMIALVGPIVDGVWKFDEYPGSICTNCKPNATFEGRRVDDTVSGFWTSGDGSKRLPFRFVQEPLTKATVFGWMRGGEWALDGAEGFYGANTMTGLQKDARGRWSAGGSSIVAAMREGYDSDLSKDEKRRLDRFRILVTDSLDLVVMIDTAEVLRVPYGEEPVFDLVRITPETDGIGRIHEYRKKPGLTLGSVNIATTDRGRFDELLQVDAMPLDTPSAAHIEYGTLDDAFGISLISADCCATQDLSFRRVPGKAGRTRR